MAAELQHKGAVGHSMQSTATANPPLGMQRAGPSTPRPRLLVLASPAWAVSQVRSLQGSGKWRWWFAKHTASLDSSRPPLA